MERRNMHTFKVDGKRLAKLYKHYHGLVRLFVMSAIVVSCGLLYSCRDEKSAVSGTGLDALEASAGADGDDDNGGTLTSGGKAGGTGDVSVSGETGGTGDMPATGETGGTAVTDVDSEGTGNVTDCIYVYVCGCVNEPGVYAAPVASRMFQLVELAGGMTDEASESSLDMASAVYDGQTVYVPSVSDVADGTFARISEQAMSQGMTGSVGDSSSGTGGSITSGNKDKVNINTATKQQLMELSGIGETRAEGIISYREKNGSFARIEDVMNVSGIKDAAYAKIKDYICVN